MTDTPNLQFGALSGESATDTLKKIYARIAELGVRPVFVELVPLESALARLEELRARQAKGEKLPLFGVPFAVKDNFDVAGLPTTAACPAFAYTPKLTAPAVQRLLDAGAVLIGKTNMDQFATGLVGTRSPYGVCSSALDAKYIAGGSSSGSALAVALGLVSFALGTDTAGSGRVPAAFNNVVGLKPTRGLVSTRGMVPACRSLDCVSVFAGSVGDASAVLELMAGYDAEDPFSRRAPSPTSTGKFRFGVPSSLEFFGNAEYQRLFAETVKALQALGGSPVEVDIEPFVAAGKLLYGGPWVAERFAAVGEFVEAHAEETNPVVRTIIMEGKQPLAHEVFQAHYVLQSLRRQTELTWGNVDALLLPTAGTIYTVEQVLNDPIVLNANLGHYTNFVNLLDLAGVAVPAGFTAERLPFGVTLLGPAFSETTLAAIASKLQQSLGLRVGATAHELLPAPPAKQASGSIQLAVAGAHLSGMPLHHELSSRHAELVRACRTSDDYELYALAGTVPPKPGVVRRPGFVGTGIEVEVWALSPEAFGSFVAGVPAPMVIGTVQLEDGTSVKGFLCEPFALEGSRNITSFGGWRAFVKSKA